VPLCFAAALEWSACCCCYEDGRCCAGTSLLFSRAFCFCVLCGKQTEEEEEEFATKAGLTELLLEPFVQLLFATLIIYLRPAVS